MRNVISEFVVRVMRYSCRKSYLAGHAGFAAKHQAVGGELGRRVHRGPEKRQDRIDEIVPVGLLLRHHLLYGVLQQSVRALQQSVVLDLQLQAPALAQLLAHLQHITVTLNRTVCECVRVIRERERERREEFYLSTEVSILRAVYGFY